MFADRSTSAGCHGAGKTALTAEFEKMGFPVLDEGFMTMSTKLLHPQVSEPNFLHSVNSHANDQRQFPSMLHCICAHSYFHGCSAELINGNNLGVRMVSATHHTRC